MTQTQAETQTRTQLHTRRNVWDLGGDWADPILWYARGVRAMQQRPLAEPTSWRFYAGIHGFNPALWEQLGFFSASDPMPSSALVKQFWLQCQHGSWYFLPWHRGYLLALEANIRAAVVQLGGPADWALPYWNYFKHNESKLPPAFASRDWPDGVGDNPLFVEPRYGPNGDGDVFVPLRQVNLNAMRDPDFTGVSSGGSPGFGGVDTGFSHSGPVHGGIETQPHDWVHGLVGGSLHNDQSKPGAMSVPASAALDPIFWLHHANIDRLWASWNHELIPPHVDPTEAQWLDGPASSGERAFTMPMPDGSTWTYTPEQMKDIHKLGYRYDHLSPVPSPPSPNERLQRLGMPALAEGVQAMPAERNVELVGATPEAVPIQGSDVRSGIRLDASMRSKVVQSLSPSIAAAGQPAPDRVFLNLENVRGRTDAAAFDVYIGVPEDADTADHANRLAGSIAPFGLAQASQADEEHGGQGLTFVFEITDIVDQLHLANALDVDNLPVRIVPVHPVSPDAGLSIGRISIYRQGS